MTKMGSLLILPGDGIGPEVMRETRRVIDWFSDTQGAILAIDTGLVGGASYDAHGVPLTDATLAKAASADAVLFGAIGGPQYETLPYELRPERGLLALRQALCLFANLRPARCFPALVASSSLKPEFVTGLDIMIVRELTGGIYFGHPRGIENLPDGQRRGINTQVYTTEEIRRVVRFAAELAGQRGGRLCSVDKANVMESGLLWREEAAWVVENEYPGVQLSHMYADNCAMQLCRRPAQFDVIVTDNLFGDILSDEAAMLTGSLGMLPSASLGAANAAGARKALYEPIHGSAPDIAEQDKANPLACILSLAMAYRYSFGRVDCADLLESAVSLVLDNGIRTADIAEPGHGPVTTTGMGDAVLDALAQLQREL